jgi:hypothetical protein
MPLPRTSKEKSARIDWGYVRRPSRLARVRGWLWVLAALLIVAPLTAATVAAALTDRTPAPLALAASRGPLARPHAAWEEKCEVCHTPFTSIRTGHAADSGRCETCHAPAAHHPNQRPEDVVGCADCHREHQGRTASLTRLTDDTCVRCHAALTEHAKVASSNTTAKQATGFAHPAGHPEFRAVDASRGKADRTLKFSHATHLAKGMAVGSGFTFAKIANEAERARWMTTLGRTDPATVVQLDCKACHQLEADGRTYKPATFEQHCRACHPLTFDDSAALRSIQAPHHVQPDELDRFLRRVYTERFVADGLKATKQLDRGPGRLDPPPTVVAAARGKIDVAVTAARQTLLGGRTTCLECHFIEQDRIVPAKIPATWMPNARFDHTSHRALDCRQCHAQAFADKANETAAARAWSGRGELDAAYQHRPDLPDAANCRQCHSPAGGVRHGCTDCHAYHAPGPGRPAHPFPSAAEWLGSR